MPSGGVWKGVPSPQVQRINAPPIADNYQRGTSSGRSRKDGVSRHAAIFALGPEESKGGENAVRQVSCRMLKVWENPKRPATLSSLPVPAIRETSPWSACRLLPRKSRLSFRFSLNDARFAQLGASPVLTGIFWIPRLFSALYLSTSRLSTSRLFLLFARNA